MEASSIKIPVVVVVVVVVVVAILSSYLRYEKCSIFALGIIIKGVTFSIKISILRSKRLIRGVEPSL